MKLLPSSLVLLLLIAVADAAEPWENPPPLPSPANRIVTVATEPQLQQAVANLQSGTAIVIAKGEYNLTHTLHLRGRLKNVALRGATGQRDDVVLRGRGIRNKDYGNVPHGIMVSDCTDVQIADLSVGDVWFHPITLQGPAGCQRVKIYNCRLFEAGEQFLKSNPASPDGAKGGVDDSSVEYCVFEFADTARHWYTEGIDVHAGSRWTVRCNLFRNIRAPADDKMAGGAIDFWNRSKDNVVERNTIINCEVGIRMGIMDREGYDDCSGGIVRNNMIYRAKDACAHGDVGILVADSPGTKVLHNTVILEDGYANAIEYRFPASKGLVISGNLTNKAIRQRDGAEAKVSDNINNAKPAWFKLPDLHLSKAANVAKVAASSDCADDIDGEKRRQQTSVGADEP
jgi:hypothetical protein